MDLREAVLTSASIRCGSRSVAIVLRARSCSTSILLDERHAAEAIARGHATWVTKILGVPRRLCLEDPLRCILAAIEALLSMDACSVRAADKVSARCLARLVCWFVGVGPPCVDKAVKILLGAED